MKTRQIIIFALISSVAYLQEYGMIAYFENRCPDGWTEYTESAGRVIISKGVATDSAGTTMTFNPGDQGGEFKHQCTIDEMPSHQHQSGVGAWFNLHGGGYRSYDASPSRGPTPFYHDSNSSLVGGGLPMNIMQPYVVAIACKLTKQQDQSGSLESLQNLISALQAEVNDKISKSELERLVEQMHDLKSLKQKLQEQEEEINQLQYKLGGNISISELLYREVSKIENQQASNFEIQKAIFILSIITFVGLFALVFSLLFPKILQGISCCCKKFNSNTPQRRSTCSSTPTMR